MNYGAPWLILERMIMAFVMFGTPYGICIHRKNKNNWFFLRRVHQWPMESPHKGQLMLEKFPFYNFIISIRMAYHETTLLLKHWS